VKRVLFLFLEQVEEDCEYPTCSGTSPGMLQNTNFVTFSNFGSIILLNIVGGATRSFIPPPFSVLPQTSSGYSSVYCLLTSIPSSSVPSSLSHQHPQTIEVVEFKVKI
jgi:hypothetical protein